MGIFVKQVSLKPCLFIWHFHQVAKHSCLSHLPSAPLPSILCWNSKFQMILPLIFLKSNGLSSTPHARKLQTWATLTVLLSVKKLWMMTMILHHPRMILFYVTKNHWLMTMFIKMHKSLPSLTQLIQTLNTYSENSGKSNKTSSTLEN